MEIDCIKHCRAACCRNFKYINLSRKEAAQLRGSGTSLLFIEEKRNGKSEYEKVGNCGFEKNGRCTTHNLKPATCNEFQPGSRDCLKFRAENPKDVVELTEADEKFQNWYFGWD